MSERRYREAGGPVVTVQASGQASGLPVPADNTMCVCDDAPYADVQVADGTAGAAVLTDSPMYGGPSQPYDGTDAMAETWVGRQQPPLGLGAGSYALATAVDLGAPRDDPEHGLPGLRAGAYLFSRRELGAGDQGIMDPVLQGGGSYLEVNQPPYVTDDRPMGR